MPASTPEHAQCLSCGYSLAGLRVGRCPECGWEFNPNDPQSVRPRGLTAMRWIAGSMPPWIVNSLYGAYMLYLVVVSSSPDGSVSDGTAGYVGFVFLSSLFIWAVWFVVHLLGRLWLRMKRFRAPSWSWGWTVVPGVLIVFVVLTATGAVWHTRWYFARASFARLAATPVDSWKPGWYGTFHVVEIERLPQGSVSLHLGFPDLYSDQVPQMRLGPWTGGSTATLQLDGGWWFSWDPS